MLQPMGLQRVRHNLATEQEEEEAHSPGEQLRTRQSLLRSVGLQESDLTEQLSAHTHTHTHTQGVWSRSSGQDVQTWRQTEPVQESWPLVSPCSQEERTLGGAACGGQKRMPPPRALAGPEGPSSGLLPSSLTLDVRGQQLCGRTFLAARSPWVICAWLPRPS